MGTIDFRDVKEGTYVRIDGYNCKSIYIDGTKVWEYMPSSVVYTGYTDDISGKESEINGYGFSGSSWVNFTITNEGTANSLIKPSGSYSYPVGENTLTMRDGEYFLVMDINMSESPSGKSVSIFSNTLKFKRQYKKVVVSYDIWSQGYTGIDDIELRVTFGTKSETINASDAVMGAVTLESTTASDSIIFEWHVSGNLIAKRTIDDLFLVVDNIVAYA